MLSSKQANKFSHVVLCAIALSVLLSVIGCLPDAGPRPPNTTDPAIFAGDGALIDYCDLPLLDGSGLLADDIPKAYTPEGYWQTWPLPVLANCTEPLADGVVDIRGLWTGNNPLSGPYIERIELCGNRFVLTGSGIIHDLIADGSLENGANDIEAPPLNNVRIRASGEWVEGVLALSPFGGDPLVFRYLDGDELVWIYAGIETRMQRVCFVP